MDFIPRMGELVNRFRSREPDARESLDFARHALLMPYDSVESAAVGLDTLLKARRAGD